MKRILDLKGGEIFTIDEIARENHLSFREVAEEVNKLVADGEVSEMPNLENGFYRKITTTFGESVADIRGYLMKIYVGQYCEYGVPTGETLEYMLGRRTMVPVKTEVLTCSSRNLKLEEKANMVVTTVTREVIEKEKEKIYGRFGQWS